MEGVRPTHEVEDLAADLKELAHGYEGFSNVQKTYAIRENARRLLALTADPERQWEEYMIQMAEIGAVRIFHHLYAFKKIPRDGSVTYRELADQLGAETRLIERFGNMLVSVGILNREGENRISHTPRSHIYLDDHPSGLMAVCLNDEMNVPCGRWPDFFDQYGLKVPGGSFTTTPHTFAWGQPDKNLWEVMSQNKRRMEEFTLGMNILEKYLPCLGMYDFSSLADYAKNGADKERKLIVDVGCGKGHSLNSILEESPEIPPERCVLQDRADVIEHVKRLDEPLLRGAEKQVIDFFKDQPVKGALIYYIRRCMHDWSDDFNVTILSILRAACAPDSRILITEQVLDSPPNPSQSCLDMCMLNIGGTERTEKMFREVADRAGLEVVNVYPDKKSPVAVIECAPK